METSAFYYKRKPAFISFLLVYIASFGVSFLLIDHTQAISREVTGYMAKLPIPHPNILLKLPYGTIFSFPFLIYGIRTLLWNMMTSYEITPSEIHLLAGSLTRKERYFLISNFYEISFKQSLIEAPFRAGTLILRKDGAEVIIKGVYDVRCVAESLRGKTDKSYR